MFSHLSFFPEDIKQRQTQGIAAQIQAKHILVQAKHILAVSQHAEMQGCHAMLRHFVSNPRLDAGINCKQLSHYVTGYRKPSTKTIQRIQNGVARLAETFSHIQMV